MIHMKSINCIIVCCLLLTGCAQTPVRTVPEAVPQPVETPKPPVEAVLPAVELSDDLLYEFLLTEIASQRGHNALAVESSADLAQKTRDPRLARRAAQLAFESGDMNRAIDSFKLWLEVEPGSQLGQRMLASLLLRGGKLDEAQQVFSKLLEDDKANLGTDFMQLYQMSAPYPDKQASLNWLRELANPYPQVAEAHWAVAQLALQAGSDPLALTEVRKARSLRPDLDLAASLEAQLLQKSEPQQSLETLRRYLEDYPEAQEIRLQYARLLLEQKQLELSRAQFQRIASASPDNAELAFAIALISLQLNDLPGAEAQLLESLAKGKKDQDTVHYFLAQLAEAKENPQEALAHYRLVAGGDHLFGSHLRIAFLLNKLGKLDEAREYLQQSSAENNQQRVQLLLVEAQMLREAKRQQEALEVLQQGLVKLPNHPDLLYETGMLADRLGKTELFEQLMRRIIQNNPDYAQAYNALGYSFLERNERIPEALTLVEKALQLAPEDAAIMDSVGWGYYRSDRLDESLKLLRRAFKSNQDPEIAAHLGEVLWLHGEHEEARQLLQETLKTHSGNVQLLQIIKKYLP